MVETKEKSSVDRRIRKTKKLLRQGLVTLLMKKNLKDITIKELVDLIDINRGTFYLHARDLHDLLRQLEEEMMQELTEILNSFSCDELKLSLEPYLAMIIDYLSDNADLCLALLGENGDITFVNKLIDTVKHNCFGNLKETYPNLHPCHYEDFATFVVSGSVGVLRQWLETGRKRSSREIASALSLMIRGGVAFMTQPPSARSADSSANCLL